jgi:hypothetical protein
VDAGNYGNDGCVLVKAVIGSIEVLILYHI